LDEPIHNNDGIEMLRFDEQTCNWRKLWVSPGQSTICRQCIMRGSV